VRGILQQEKPHFSFWHAGVLRREEITVSSPPMSSSPAFVCSMCRKPIAVGAKVVKCAVSTCNTGRVKLVFCSASCWDSHLPNARHRTAYFVEEIARRE
jgi:LSD1 subclass zinc finger protein